MLSSLEILFLSSHSTFSNIPCVRSPININQQGSIEDIIYKPEIHSLCHLIFSVFWGIADPGSCWPCPNSHSHPESYVHLTPSLTYVQWRKDWYAFVTALWWCGVLCSLHLKQSVVRRRCLMRCRTLTWQLWLLCYGCYGWKQVWKAFLSYVGITGLWHSCTQQQGRAPLMLHQCCFLYAPLVIRATMSLLSAVSTYGNKGPEIRPQLLLREHPPEGARFLLMDQFSSHWYLSRASCWQSSSLQEPHAAEEHSELLCASGYRYVGNTQLRQCHYNPFHLSKALQTCNVPVCTWEISPKKHAMA